MKTNIFMCVLGTRCLLALSWLARTTPALTGKGLLCSSVVNLQNEGMVRAGQRQNGGELVVPLHWRET